MQNHCGCMVDDVTAKYDYATFQRIDNDVRAKRHTPAVAAMGRDILENGLKACPPPDD